MGTRLLTAGAVLLCAVMLGAGLSGCPPKGPNIAQITENFQNSLHATRQGKATWWDGDTEEPGFGSLLGNEIINGCLACHAETYADGTVVDTATYQPGCGDCHVDGANPSAHPVDAPTICLGCHGRQAKELYLGDPNNTNPVVAARFTDVHRDAGMTCSDCHGFDEIHGDGNAYTSMLDSPSASCDDCHVAGGTGPIPESSYSHDTHTATLDCSACHVQTIVSCYNCHIETLVDSHQKLAAGAPNGFMLLMNNLEKGKVYPGSFQSATFDGQKMIAVGGFFGHTITAAGRVCEDCHNNANIQTYNQTGVVTLGVYDEVNQKVIGAAGVLPVPPDYKDAIKLDFLNYDSTSGLWSIIVDEQNPENTMTPDLVQIAPTLMAPLTDAQMQKLSLPISN